MKIDNLFKFVILILAGLFLFIFYQYAQNGRYICTKITNDVYHVLVHALELFHDDIRISLAFDPFLILVSVVFPKNAVQYRPQLYL